MTAGKAFTLKVINLKKTEKKKVKYKDKNGKKKTKTVMDYPKVVWTSSSKSVATVKDGKVTAIRYGTATITAMFKRKTDKKAKVYTCKVTVKRPSYVVNAATKPLPASAYTKNAAYNKYTEHYYMLRSYVEDLEKRGGGTLTLAAGTYSVTNVIYIPSNTKIILSNGVYIKNSNNTNTSKLSPAKTVFHFCASSKARAALKYTGSKLGKYKGGYVGYEGVHDSAIIGYGGAIIDMMGVSDRYGAVIPHAKNISVTGVNFQGIRNGHGIEVNGSRNVTISGCDFIGDSRATSKSDEAINIDTPDLRTGGINVPYIKYDKTPCLNVVVKNCVFRDLPRAVGSHTYSYNYPHENISVLNNDIQNTYASAIGAMYWQDSLIKGNIIQDVMNKYHGISGEGVTNLKVEGNQFINMVRAAQFIAWDEDDYPVIRPVIFADDLADILNKNVFIDVIHMNIKLVWERYDKPEYFPYEPEPEPEPETEPEPEPEPEPEL
ncbi:MAG: right-handed parallel beta-helix repeat-containing protein [Clostridiales Family XIII bacterium]|nr:right-handed parallel beta-helix repeat-containing protein [Clostridiales Family XIII bacterium]